jgi:hypothetical protein
MFNFNISDVFDHNYSYDGYIKNAKKICAKLISQIEGLSEDDYEYSLSDVVDELGLDKELIDSLVEDYVKQILRYIPIFKEYILSLREDKKAGKVLDYTPLRDLAHKNLGVARNLRIKDAQTILNEIRKKEDLDYLMKCVKILEACAISLKPEVAYKIYKEK